jgi:hypothetical protein
MDKINDRREADKGVRPINNAAHPGRHPGQADKSTARAVSISAFAYGFTDFVTRFLWWAS